MEQITIFWFRRDLRLFDNHGFYEALISGFSVLPIFIFDCGILKKLAFRNDARISFIYNEVIKMKTKIEEHGSSLRIYYSEPLKVFQKLVEDYNIVSVYANKDYEPYAIKRDNKIKLFLKGKGVDFKMYKDHVIFHENDILTNNRTPYTIFTPFLKKWRMSLKNELLFPYRSDRELNRLKNISPFDVPSLGKLGFVKSNIIVPFPLISDKKILEYSKKRDYPSIEGTSKLGVHLRFGTISIRELIRRSLKLSDVFVNELIWREFYSMIIWHYPEVEYMPFRKKYNFIEWENDIQEFKRWCNGETGYPMVDAGMRELNATGYMHNRIRMVTASFLTKHLLIDWRWGEAYFAERLLDYELASNNGNWQWAAGTGCDAVPYFRIFNPISQQKKFDSDERYIKRWVPEFKKKSYPDPIIEHKFARARALETYKKALISI